MNPIRMSRENEHVQFANEGRARALLEAAPTGWMETLGATISEAEPGRVVLELVAGPQHRHGGGVVQGGVITQIADAAMGMSLATLQQDGMWNTTIDLKLNFISAAKVGEKLLAVGHVVHAGRRTAVTECRVEGPGGRLVATASGTFAITREKGITEGSDAD